MPVSPRLSIRNVAHSRWPAAVAWERQSIEQINFKLAHFEVHSLGSDQNENSSDGIIPMLLSCGLQGEETESCWELLNEGRGNCEVYFRLEEDVFETWCANSTSKEDAEKNATQLAIRNERAIEITPRTVLVPPGETVCVYVKARHTRCAQVKCIVEVQHRPALSISLEIATLPVDIHAKSIEQMQDLGKFSVSSVSKSCSYSAPSCENQMKAQSDRLHYLAFGKHWSCPQYIDVHIGTTKRIAFPLHNFGNHEICVEVVGEIQVRGVYTVLKTQESLNELRIPGGSTSSLQLELHPLKYGEQEIRLKLRVTLLDSDLQVRYETLRVVLNCLPRDKTLENPHTTFPFELPPLKQHLVKMPIQSFDFGTILQNSISRKLFLLTNPSFHALHFRWKVPKLDHVRISVSPSEGVLTKRKTVFFSINLVGTEQQARFVDERIELLIYQEASLADISKTRTSRRFSKAKKVRVTALAPSAKVKVLRDETRRRSADFGECDLQPGTRIKEEWIKFNVRCNLLDRYSARFYSAMQKRCNVSDCTAAALALKERAEELSTETLTRLERQFIAMWGEQQLDQLQESCSAHDPCTDTGFSLSQHVLQSQVYSSSLQRGRKSGRLAAASAMKSLISSAARDVMSGHTLSRFELAPTSVAARAFAKVPRGFKSEYKILAEEVMSEVLRKSLEKSTPQLMRIDATGDRLRRAYVTVRKKPNSPRERAGITAESQLN